MSIRTDADLTDDEIYGAGADLEARAREIRARGDSAMSDTERAELISIIETHDAKYDNRRLKLDRAHPLLVRAVAAGALDRAARRQLRQLAAGALDFEAGYAAGDMIARRAIARRADAQDANASVAEVRAAIHGMRQLPRRDALEHDERAAMVRRLSNGYCDEDN